MDWGVALGYAIFVFAIYDRIAVQFPEAIRSFAMPFVSAAMAFAWFSFASKIRSLFRDVEWLKNQTSNTSAHWTVEDRLDELERLKRRAMVTPEEYEAKRKDILNDL